MQRRDLLLLLLAARLPALPRGSQPPERAEITGSDWRAAMRPVHAQFHGQKGTFAHFGDSITETLAFWSPLPFARKNAPPEMERAFKQVNAILRPQCWRAWKGPEFGNQGGKTIRWAHENIDGWLRKLNPEVALVQFGTNDLRALELDEYQEKTRIVVQRCLDNGTVVILSTIPPRHGFEKKAETFAQAVRKIAREMNVPLIDFHAEILKRRPNDWDGASEKFAAYQDYDVPTLIARDGVHPSLPKRFENDYSETALRSNGYSLRNYLTLRKYAEVLDALTPSLPSRPWFPKAPPLPAPRGEVIRAANPDELYRAVERVHPGGTILLADGFYALPRYFVLKTDNVTLRGASGKREKVILDGSATHGELIGISACSGVTIADLTVQNVKWNGIKINSETGVQRARIYNCVLRNIWQRAVKGVAVPEPNREKTRPTACRVQYCLFTNDRPKRFDDDPSDTPQTFDGNYVGGIDVMYAKNWVISDNVFVGIQGRTGSARGAIFVWHESEDCVIERNVILDCDSGICLGNAHKPADVRVHCRRFVVRNNFLARVPENGILADYTEGCKILHNTVHDPGSRQGRLLRLVHDNDDLLVAGNLLSGPPIRNESASKITFRNNRQKDDLTAAFVAASEGNLRLTARATDAIDRAALRPEAGTDMDRHPRGRTPDIGAHEWQGPKRKK